MKHVRFFLEYPTNKDKRQGTRKQPGNHSGNVIAIFDNGPAYNGYQDCMAALTDTPNSVVCGTSASFEYLAEKCKRISEALARTIHPNLFIRLDEDNAREES